VTENGVAARDEFGRKLKSEKQLNAWQITIVRKAAGPMGFIE
jgi:hypothetical protein